MLVDSAGQKFRKGTVRTALSCSVVSRASARMTQLARLEKLGQEGPLSRLPPQCHHWHLGWEGRRMRQARTVDWIEAAINKPTRFKGRGLAYLLMGGVAKNSWACFKNHHVLFPPSPPPQATRLSQYSSQCSCWNKIQRHHSSAQILPMATISLTAKNKILTMTIRPHSLARLWLIFCYFPELALSQLHCLLTVPGVSHPWRPPTYNICTCTPHSPSWNTLSPDIHRAHPSPTWSLHSHSTFSVGLRLTMLSKIANYSLHFLAPFLLNCSL